MKSIDSITRRRALGLGLALGVAGCAPKATKELERMTAIGRPSMFDWKLHAPEEVGMSRAGLENVRAAIRKYVDKNEITGAVAAIARHNKLVWYEAQGVRDVTTGEPMRKDDLFRMMSSTKVVTAVAVLQMMDEGKLALDDKVNRFIPTFKDTKVAVTPPNAKEASQVQLVPANRDITIKDLLTHTSGLSSSGEASLVNKIERRPDDTLADYIPRLGSAALDFQPGSKFRYSPLDGFDVLLRIVEIASGMPADAFLRERLFEPLEMRDTYFHVPPEKQERILTLYARKEGAWSAQPSLLGLGPKYICGAGGLFSTVRDFMQFEAMLLNRGSLNGHRILKDQTVALMSSNQVGSMFAEWFPAMTAGHGFGLSVRIVEDSAKGSGRSVGAFGWGGAYGTESWADPELDVAAALFIQQPVTAVQHDFQRALRDAIVDRAAV
ncbi:serine hydrolase domain-containing protein [Steroidobacter flavus]|uniref:Serine hydrolase domain-containing protein n=1 Tax=Steroidobacter flavus TaxID=1842136 RepID=A0ABV8SY33_9GAMM